MGKSFATAFVISLVQYVCTAQHLTNACNLKCSVQHDSACQPAMHGHVSALKPYVIIRFEFGLAKLPVGADAVSSQGVREGPNAGNSFCTAHGKVEGSIVDAAASDCTQNKSLLFAQSLPLIRAGLEGTAGFLLFLVQWLLLHACCLAGETGYYT